MLSVPGAVYPTAASPADVAGFNVSVAVSASETISAAAAGDASTWQ